MLMLLMIRGIACWVKGSEMLVLLVTQRCAQINSENVGAPKRRAKMCGLHKNTTTMRSQLGFQALYSPGPGVSSVGAHPRRPVPNRQVGGVRLVDNSCKHTPCCIIVVLHVL